MSKYIIIDNKGGSKELNSFPSADIANPISGFDYENNDIYIVETEDRPIYDSNKSYLKALTMFTPDLHPDYYKVKICNKGWDIVDHTQEEVIERLNSSLGAHLDTQYPLWERAKHAGEGNYILWAKSEGELTQEQLDRKDYIDNVYAWITRCRDARDNKEKELIEDDVFPSFEWEDR